MATKGIRELFGDALIDPELRARLVVNTEGAVRIGQYELDGDEMEMIKELVARENLADFTIEELDERIALCSAAPGTLGDVSGVVVTSGTVSAAVGVISSPGSDGVGAPGSGTPPSIGVGGAIGSAF